MSRSDEGVAVELSEKLRNESQVAQSEGQARTQQAAELRDALSRLQGLQHSCGPSQFRGQTAVAFAAQLQEMPSSLSGIAEGLDDVSAALSAYSRELADLSAQAARTEQQRDKARQVKETAARDIATCEQAVTRARTNLTAAREAERSAARDLTPAGPAAYAAAAGHAARQQAGLSTALGLERAARERHTAAITAERRADAELDDLRKQYQDRGDRCADKVLDARDKPWHQDAWDLVQSLGRALTPSGTDIFDLVNGLAYAPVAGSQWLAERAAKIPIKDLKDARKRGTKAEREAARRAYNAALREVRTLKKSAKTLASVPVPGWLQKLNRPLGSFNQHLDKVKYVRGMPIIGVGAGVVATYADVQNGDMGVAHAVAKNGAAVAAGMATTAAVAGAVTIGATIGAPVVIGVVAGTAASILVGAAVEEWGDDVGEAAEDAGRAVGRGLGSVWDKVNG